MFHVTGLMALGRGLKWERLIYCGRQRSGGKRKANCLFVNENLEYLRIKYYNLHSQTNAQYFIVLSKTPTLMAHSFPYQKT